MSDPVMPNPIQDDLDEIKKAFDTDSYFSGIPIIEMKKGDILNEIQRALGKLGICIVIEWLGLKLPSPDIGTLDMDLRYGITVTENVLINQGSTGSKKPALEVMMRALCLLNPSRGSVPVIATEVTPVSDTNGMLIVLINCRKKGAFEFGT